MGSTGPCGGRAPSVASLPLFGPHCPPPLRKTVVLPPLCRAPSPSPGGLDPEEEAKRAKRATRFAPAAAAAPAAPAARAPSPPPFGGGRAASPALGRAAGFAGAGAGAGMRRVPSSLGQGMSGDNAAEDMEGDNGGGLGENGEGAPRPAPCPEPALGPRKRGEWSSRGALLLRWRSVAGPCAAGRAIQRACRHKLVAALPARLACATPARLPTCTCPVMRAGCRRGGRRRPPARDCGHLRGHVPRGGARAAAEHERHTGMTHS